MKFGVREICDVVLRAKTAQKIGNKIFYKNEPVCYFDTLKTSTLEGAATTVYAQGGRGNARLMAWDGERTVTFTMEDALISPIGLSLLTGAGLIEATGNQTMKQHITETVEASGEDAINDSPVLYITQKPHVEDTQPTIYVMVLNDSGEIVSEPYLYRYTNEVDANKGYKIVIDQGLKYAGNANDLSTPHLNEATTFLVDYYTDVMSGGFEVNITPDKFGGTFYLEASTLWRDQASGKDFPAEFIIPSCKIQSNFTFSMSSSGDPSTFTFTMDAFPDYTRWDRKQKVLATIQVIGANLNNIVEPERPSTWTTHIEKNGIITPGAESQTLLTPECYRTNITRLDGTTPDKESLKIVLADLNSEWKGVTETVYNYGFKIRVTDLSTSSGNDYYATKDATGSVSVENDVAANVINVKWTIIITDILNAFKTYKIEIQAYDLAQNYITSPAYILNNLDIRSTSKIIDKKNYIYSATVGEDKITLNIQPTSGSNATHYAIATLTESSGDTLPYYTFKMVTPTSVANVTFLDMAGNRTGVVVPISTSVIEIPCSNIQTNLTTGKYIYIAVYSFNAYDYKNNVFDADFDTAHVLVYTLTKLESSNALGKNNVTSTVIANTTGANPKPKYKLETGTNGVPAIKTGTG